MSTDRDADLTAPLLELLSVVRDGLTLPDPIHGWEAHDRAVARRAIEACVTIGMVLATPEHTARLAAGLRERYAEAPVTYAVSPPDAQEVPGEVSRR